MSSGTFSYPLCFSAMLVVIGLMVLPRTDHTKLAPATSSLHGTTTTKTPFNPKIAAELMERCDEFIRKYPDSEHSEDVATLAGEALVQMGDWKKVAAYYRGLEDKFPKSESIDRFVFFQGLAFFMDADFKEAIPLLNRVLKNHPKSTLVENASYYLAMAHFLSNNYEETLTACAEHLKKFPEGKYAKELGDEELRLKNLKDLLDEPKLKHTVPYKKAAEDAK